MIQRGTTAMIGQKTKKENGKTESSTGLTRTKRKATMPLTPRRDYKVMNARKRIVLEKRWYAVLTIEVGA